MERTLYIIALLIISAAFADVVENVVVDTSQAPSNYVVSYTLNPIAGYVNYSAEIKAVLSSDNGDSYPFYFDTHWGYPLNTVDKNFPINYSGDINTYVNLGNHTFNFQPYEPIVIPNAKIMVTAEIVEKFTQTTGTVWKCVTATAPWSGRSGHQSVAFDNKMWVIGGNYTNDVWSSPDGSNWTQVTAHAAWSERTGHQSVVFDKKSG